MLSTTQHYTTLHNITQDYTRLYKTKSKNTIQLCIYRVGGTTDNAIDTM